MKTFLILLCFAFSLGAKAQTKINPDDVQILFVEAQTHFISQSKTEKPKRIVEASVALAKVAQVLKIPVTYCVVPVNGKAEGLIPELIPFATPETTYSRTVTSPFLEPKIVNAVKANKRKILIIAGFAAEVAVLQSTLDARSEGFEVQVPIDAIGSISERTERAALTQIEKAGGNTTSVLSLVMRLAPDISNPPGTLTFQALQPILKPAK